MLCSVQHAIYGNPRGDLDLPDAFPSASRPRSGFGEESYLKTLEITRADLRQIKVYFCSVKGKMHSMLATRLAKR